MLHDQLIVCLATLGWDFLWQRHHEFAARFARAGNRVLFIEPIGIRMLKWYDWRRIVARLEQRRRARPRGVRAVARNLWVVDPLVYPWQHVGFVHQCNVNLLTRQLQEAIAAVGGGAPIFWTYVPTALANDVMARVPHLLVVYDCVDALAENPKGVFASLASFEKLLLQTADVVLVSSQTLRAQYHAWNPALYYVPHGVEYERFADGTLRAPEPLKAIPHPRLLFFGGTDERLDLSLVARLAEKHAAWQFVFVGVVETSVARLKKFSNVHFLPQVAHAQLPAYLHHADVLLLPYCQSAYTYHMLPAKVFECLASGKPAVATALPNLAEYGAVMYLAQSDAEFEDGITRALAERAPAAQSERRRAIARANTWTNRFETVNELLDAHLRA